MLRRLISQFYAGAVPIAPRVYTADERRLLWERSMESLMEYISDIPMLYALISISSTARSLFEDTPKRYLKMATDNVFAELQQLVVAMLAAHSLQQREPSVVDPFLDMYLDGYGPDMKTLDAIKDPFNALQDLYETYMAIETFTPLFAKSRIQNMYLPTKGSQPWGLRYTDAIWEPDLHHLVLISRRWHDDLPEDGTWPSELPLSDDESYRIKRALWRFQLYSVLFHLPGFNDTCNIAMNIASAQTQPLLIDQQCRYLGKFNAWEVEELATVYDYLLTYLEACYDGPVTTKDIDRVTSQAEDPLTDGQSTTRNENLTTTTDSPSLETPGVDQDAAIQAEVEHFRRRIRYQLSRGLPFLYKFKLKLENVGPNDYVDGFDLENHTLDVGLGEALWHPNMACKNHGSRYLPGIGPQWDPAIGSFGKAGHPLRVWPDNPYAHIPTAGWKICIALRSWKATLVEVYASEELQAMRAVGGIFFDGVDELEDYTSLESREEDEEELLWDWDDWCHFDDSRTAGFLCKVKRAVKIIAGRALHRATGFVGLELQYVTEFARWMC